MNWTSITKSLPPPSEIHEGNIILWTKNGKVMVVANRSVDGWLIDKYAITHWMIPIPPSEHMLLDWATCDDDYLLPGD